MTVPGHLVLYKRTGRRRYGVFLVVILPTRAYYTYTYTISRRGITLLNLSRGAEKPRAILFKLR